MKNKIDYIFLAIGIIIWLISVFSEIINISYGMIIMSLLIFTGYIFGERRKKMTKKQNILFLLLFIYILN